MPKRINVKNRTLFHGDNLDFLRSINTGTIHLIATDPPFNKGRDFHATPDSLAAGAKFKDRWSWKQDVHETWTDQIQDDWPAVWRCIDHARNVYGDDMGAFLCFLGVRMIEMHRILRPDGSIYLHCDPTASHYIKTLMDAVFGHRNFRNEIVWCYTGPSGTKKKFPQKHDTILRYTRGGVWTFSADAVRIPYKEGARFTMGGGGSLARRSKNGTTWEDGVEEQLEKGKIVEDYWTDIPSLSVSKERIGFPTQKPIALYERIIQASSNPGDWVLDPFCGCATTPVAAEILGRKWIGMDLWERSLGILAYRFRKQAIKISQGDDILRQFLAELKTARTKSPGESKMIDDVQAVLDQDPLPGTERGEITFATEPPLRSADRARTPPVLRTPEGKVSEPRQSREEMFLSLIQKDGMVCRGCDREFDDRLYLELDHMLPKSDGGTNAIENRALLCGPCNRIKSNKLTLTGLRAQNRKLRRMAGQS